MYRFALVLGLLAACGSKQSNNTPGGGNVDAGNDGGSSVDGGTPDSGNGGGNGVCNTACWTAADRPLTLPPRTTPPVANFDYPVCNENGVGPDACPTGFACTATQSTPLDPTHFLTRKVCAPTNAAIPAFLIDIGQPRGVVVHFDFTLNGSAWPTGATPGAAGRIVLSPHPYGASITRTMPTQSGGLDVTLAPGTYDVSFEQFGTFDVTHYPTVPLRGTLEVVAAGTVHLDFKGQSVPFAIGLDNVPMPALSNGDRVIVTFAGYHGQDVSINQITGTLPASVMLEPDSYQVTLEIRTSDSTSTLPSGKVVLADPLVVNTGATAVYSVPTYHVSGAITLDNAALPANAASFVSFGDHNSLRVDATSHYQARLLAGTYDVVFAGSCPGGSSGAVRLINQFTAANTTLDLPVFSVAYSGTITIKFAAPAPAASRGAIVLNVPNSRFAPQAVPLAVSGAATGSQRVFGGVYQVALRGENTLPRYAVLDSNATIGPATTESYNLVPGAVQVKLTDNGQAPADGTAGRGTILLRSADARIPLTALTASNTGAWSSPTVPMLAGLYTVQYTNDSSYAGLPSGTISLGTINIMADMTLPVTYDLRPAMVTGEIRRNGQPLSAPATVTFGAHSVTLPVSAATTVNAQVLPGIQDVLLQCDACGENGDSVSQYLLFGVLYR